MSFGLLFGQLLLFDVQILRGQFPLNLRSHGMVENSLNSKSKYIMAKWENL